jgi:type I restriction enzyme S subunit
VTRLRFSITLNPPKSAVARLPPATEVTFAPMEALADGLGGLDIGNIRTISDVGSGSYNYFAEGDVLLAKVTPCFENGKKAVAVGLMNGIGFATSEVHVIRANTQRLDRSYLRYLLCSADFRAAGMASMTGAGGLRRVSEDAIRDFRLPIADLENQKAIADFLDHETARLDRLIEKKERFIGVLEEKEFALTSHLMTKGIRIGVQTKPAGVPWLDQIPEHWTWVRMKDVCQRIIDCKNRTPPEADESGFFVVRTSCIRSGRFELSGGYWTDEDSFNEWTKRGRPETGTFFSRVKPRWERPALLPKNCRSAWDSE